MSDTAIYILGGSLYAITAAACLWWIIKHDR